MGALSGMLGVCLITSSRHGIWGARPQILDRLKELGASSVRSRIYTGNQGQVEWIRQLGNNGIKVNAIMGDPSLRGGSPEALVQLAGSQLNGAVASLEGANEWNLIGGGNWVGELRNHQTRLYRAAKANGATDSLPVLGPSLGRREGYGQLGSLATVLDRGNIHLYTGGFVPGYRSDEELSSERAVCGGNPICVTETGWHNASRTNATHNYTPEHVAGVYAPRLLAEYFIRGVPKIYIYELVNEPVNGSLADHEAHFGLVRSDFSRKPAFTALANFMNVLGGAPASGGGSGSLQYGIDGPGDLKTALTVRPNGSFVLLLWRTVSIFDPNRRQMLNADSKQVVINWGSRNDVRVFRPSSGSSAQGVQKGTQQTSLSLDAELVALDITRAG